MQFPLAQNFTGVKIVEINAAGGRGVCLIAIGGTADTAIPIPHDQHGGVSRLQSDAQYSSSVYLENRQHASENGQWTATSTAVSAQSHLDRARMAHRDGQGLLARV